MKSLLTLAFVAILSTVSFSQKFAHINTNELVELMPEKAMAEKELTNMHIEFEALLAELLEKYNVLYADLVQNGDNWSKVIKKIKEEELQKLQETITNAKKTAEDAMAMREFELVQPILIKAKQAITEVANEEGYEYVIDSSTGSLLVSPHNKDILELVAAKLGIEMEE
ncbi:MAG: outer membrane protein [Salibacteraceae bacterium]|jgi:outer membrane protein